MLISKTVMVRWNGFTRKHYEERGYVWTKQNDLFECKVEDLPDGSTTKVLVECDYKKEGCNGIHEKPYMQYTQDLKNGFGNCCKNKKCGAAKTKEVMLEKYGVDNILKVKEYQDKLRKMFQRPFQLIVDKAVKRDITLLTTKNEYENDGSKIRYICNIHKEVGEQSTDTETFLKTRACCIRGRGKLSGVKRKLDGIKVFNDFLEYGLIPKFEPEDYINNQTPLPYICPKHTEEGIQYKQYANLFFNNHKCKYCARESTQEKSRLDENEVFDYFRSRGLTVVEGQKYQNKDSHINFSCDKHPDYIQHVSYNSLKNTQQPCMYCRAEENLTELNKKLRSRISSWIKKSKKSCNYKCIFTGSKCYDVHHLKSFNQIIKEALNDLGYNIKPTYTGEEFIKIKNRVVELHNKYPLGICLHNDIHVLFHQIYSKESSIDDFYDFKRRFYAGEFNYILSKIYDQKE